MVLDGTVRALGQRTSAKTEEGCAGVSQASGRRPSGVVRDLRRFFRKLRLEGLPDFPNRRLLPQPPLPGSNKQLWRLRARSAGGALAGGALRGRRRRAWADRAEQITRPYRKSAKMLSKVWQKYEPN